MKWICVFAVSVALAQQTVPQQSPPQPPPQQVAPQPAKDAKPVPEKVAPAKPAAAAPDPPLSPADAMRASIEKQRASIEKQREAQRKQAESIGTWLKPGDPPPSISAQTPPEADCAPLADTVVAPLIESTAKTHEVKPEILRAVIEQESGFRPCAVSSKGAQGLMQLMPETSQELGVKNPFDPTENVSAGAKFLKQLMDKYKGDLSKALGAYNAGPAAVDQAGGIPDIQETKDYVDAILKKLGTTRTAPPNIQTPKPIEN